MAEVEGVHGEVRRPRWPRRRGPGAPGRRPRQHGPCAGSRAGAAGWSAPPGNELRTGGRSIPKGSLGGRGSLVPRCGPPPARRPDATPRRRTPPVASLAGWTRGVEGLDGQAGHVAGDRHRRPGRTRAARHRSSVTSQSVADQCLEDQASAAERVRGRHRGPPRRGFAVVAGGDGEHVDAGPEERRQVDHVVVGPPWVGADRAPGRLDPVHLEQIPPSVHSRHGACPGTSGARTCVGRARRWPGDRPVPAGWPWWRRWPDARTRSSWPRQVGPNGAGWSRRIRQG